MVPIPIFLSLPCPNLPRVPTSLRSKARSSQGPPNTGSNTHGLGHVPGDQSGGDAPGDGDTGGAETVSRQPGQQGRQTSARRWARAGRPGCQSRAFSRRDWQPPSQSGSLYPRLAPRWAMCPHGFHDDTPPHTHHFLGHLCSSWAWPPPGLGPAPLSCPELQPAPDIPWDPGTSGGVLTPQSPLFPCP